ncbi:hypothetical protein EUZ87_04810 [Lactiplantibacillus paraplantarum]|uniref:Uncharacterized protein n=1 Tax=Lactiplantibacillus paraplantarum TaxID=60520 RepID=A0A4V2L1W8_9LACO|nr:hypothetical protein EUZ87_04810 [Lactiplantibacillus paraplantarum]
MINTCQLSWIAGHQHGCVLVRPPRLGDNCWNVARPSIESAAHNPPSLKYESYSKPEATHFQLRIIWLLSIVHQPSSREAARMADERPLNSVTIVVGYFLILNPLS